MTGTAATGAVGAAMMTAGSAAASAAAGPRP